MEAPDCAGENKYESCDCCGSSAFLGAECFCNFIFGAGSGCLLAQIDARELRALSKIGNALAACVNQIKKRKRIGDSNYETVICFLRCKNSKKGEMRTLPLDKSSAACFSSFAAASSAFASAIELIHSFGESRRFFVSRQAASRAQRGRIGALSR